MGNIVLLDDLTINQIAAGEVIERPASVVKEMVENSIDAGATRITVEIKNGGISFIKVQDNGKGIAKDDLEMAFERHATSKIKKADDISKIKSMGFRGEALASIAAIANVEMVSRKKDAKMANRIVVEGGEVLEKSETGSGVGTTITVKNLFYNTPVRYKFLKKDYTESGYIEDVITRAAIAYTDISFKLINSGKPVIQTSGNGSLKDVIYAIYGKEIANNILDIDYEYEGIVVEGKIGKKEIARSNRSQQLFFVNNRYVKNKTLTAACENAYKDYIPSNKYAFVVLNVEIDPSKIDVNVHPAKLEIKFEDENLVFKAVYHAIKNRLTEQRTEVEEKEKANPISKHIRHHHFEDLDQVREPESLEEKSEIVFDAIRDDKDAYREKRSNNFFRKKPKENEFGSNENLMEEVYKFRKGLKEIGVSEVSAYAPVNIPTSEEEEKQRDRLIAESLKDKEKEKTQEIEPVEEVKEEREEEKSIFDDVLKEAEKEANKIIEKEEAEDLEDLEEHEENRGKHSASMTPSEEDVEKRTLEIIKNREHKDLTNRITPETKPTSFDDMYSKIFGNKVNQGSVVVNEEKMTEKEKSLFDEIRKSVMKKDENEDEKDDLEEKEVADEEKDVEEVKEEKTIEVDEKESIEESSDDDVMIQDDDYVEANSDEIVFSGNILDDDEDEEKEEVKDVEEKTDETEEEKVEDEEKETEIVEETIEENENKEEEEKEEDEEDLEGTPLIEVRPLENTIESEDKDWKNETLIPDESGENEEIEDVTEKSYRVVGEAFNQYVILEGNKEVAIVDLREANEKILYGKVEKDFYSEYKDNQTMLMADVIPLTNKETNLIKEYLSLFEKAGFELEAFGENTIKLNTVPNICIDMNTKHLFLELLDDTEKYDRLTEEEQEKSFIENLAKKVASTVEIDEAEGEIEKLIAELHKTQEPFKYEDGKSIAMKLSKYEIERKFSRK